MQDVFIRLWRRPPPHGELSAWLYRTSTNACIDRLRATARRDAGWRRDLACATDPPASLGDALASQELCRRLLVKADDKTRDVVALVYFDELTHQDAAELLGVTRKTVGERLEKFHDLARKVIKRWQPT